MTWKGFLHPLFFVTFFSIGAAALGGAVLCDDLIHYCRNRHLVKEAKLSLRRLESLNIEYDALLERLESDPNLLKRIAPVTLGTQREDPNAIYPRARAQELAVARKALIDKTQDEAAGAFIPRWLDRCSDPTKRIILFIAGAGLVVISLVCFAPDSADDQ